MKIAKIIYMIMNIMMLAACIAFSVIGIAGTKSLFNIIMPIASVLAMFYFFKKQKESEEPFKQLMTVMYSAHLLVVLTIAQMLMSYMIPIDISAFVVLISIVMMAIMVFVLRYIIKKLGDNDATHRNNT